MGKSPAGHPPKRRVTILRVPPVPAKQSYTRAEVRRVLGLSERKLRSWEKQELAPRPASYGFSDLVVLRTLATLRESGVSAAKIRRAVEALREKLDSVSDPLKELKIFSDRGKITVRVGGTQMEPISGQLLLDFDSTEFYRLLSFPKEPARDSPMATQASRRAEAAISFEAALRLEQRGAPPGEVIRAYERAVELDPASAGALVNLGTIYFHLRKWDDAERHYRRALEADPQYALAYFDLGNLYDEKGDRAQAMLQYLMATRLDPGYADAHYNLALLYQATGQLMRAVRHWKIYLKIDRSSTWAEIARQELGKLKRATLIQGAGGGPAARDGRK